MRSEGKSNYIGSEGLKVAAFVLVHVLGALFCTCSMEKPAIFVEDYDIRTKEGFNRNDTTQLCF